MEQQEKGLDISELINSATPSNNSQNETKVKDSSDSSNLDSLLNNDKDETIKDKTKENKKPQQVKTKTTKELTDVEETLDSINVLLLNEVEETNYQDLFMLINLRRVENILGLYNGGDNKDVDWGQFLEPIKSSLEFIIRTKGGNKPNKTNAKIQRLYDMVDAKLKEIHDSLENSINSELDSYLSKLK